MEENEKAIGPDYQAECERLKQQIQGNAEFYGQVIKEKDDEINWLKKIVEKILHM